MYTYWGTGRHAISLRLRLLRHRHQFDAALLPLADDDNKPEDGVLRRCGKLVGTFVGS